MFWLANLVGSALYCTGCAEGLEFAAFMFFGDTLPIGSDYWRGIIWTSCVNLSNLVICLVGGSAFGKMVVIFLSAVFITYGFVFYSFCADYTAFV